MDILEALKSENEGLKNVVKNINAEKTAIDQSYIGSIRECVQLRTQIVHFQEHINKLQSELNEIKNKSNKPELSIIPEDAA